jgi:hypothetical protein
LTVSQSTLQQETSGSEIELIQPVQPRPPCLPFTLKSVPVGKKKEKENVLDDDFDFLQLKEMSRTNFNDRKYAGSKLRRRTSLKPKAKVQSSVNLQTMNALVGIYSSGRPSSCKNSTLARPGSGQLFWNSLRNYSKLSLVKA